jgi:Fe-coproporphyrin III synthase
MIGVSKLYCGTVEPSDALRYGRHSGQLPSHLLQFSADKKPVVVWNITRRCNLKCVHCYAHALGEDEVTPDELTTAEGKTLLDDLAQFGAPVVLFSGGEPLVRQDLPELAAYAVSKGMRAVISTNGTLIRSAVAQELKKIGLSYVGISLDGLEEVNDLFRGVKGAFQKALEGIHACQEAGIKVGLRFTMNRRNVAEIPAIFDLLEEHDIPRVCFYHLVYAGRGSRLMEEDLSHAETRAAVDLIIDRTADLHRRGKPKEVLTVDNHADGPYIYLRLLREGSAQAAEVLELLQMNEGNSTGRGIGCVSWDGAVHADQFWRHHSFGNVRRRPFSEIWSDLSDPLMRQLKDKKPFVRGRCATCRWLDVCGGNFRVRAEAATGDLWAPDPACYLTDEEIRPV